MPYVISPYRHGETKSWVFDDPAKGLVKEAFVLGSDDMITKVVGKADRCVITFLDKPFPEHDYRLDWTRKDYIGNWYYCVQLKMTGWLCPALLRYFPTPPKRIYVKLQAQR